MTEPAPLEVPGPSRSIGERLAEVAAALPERVAVRDAGRSYGYAELLATARAWAGALPGVAAEPGRPVALDVRSDADSVVALLAVVLAGHPVVPLDPMLPDQRIEQIVASSGALRTDPTGLAALTPAGAPDLPVAGPDDPAVIFYTSGSTGEPKGVVHPHGTWLNQAYAYRLATGVTPADGNVLAWPMTFGGGLDILVMSLLNGCELIVHDARLHGVPGLVELLRGAHATTLHASPTLLRSVLDALAPGEVLPRLRLVTSGGEPVPASLIARLRGHLHVDATYVGVAGASEAGIFAFCPLPPSSPLPDGHVPVGRPAANKRIDVVGEDGRPLGPGETGIVAITSRYLSQGYLGRPELTAERFTRNPDGTTTYQGGDLGRFDAAGVLHLRGRADVAVKINGYFVEPAEVEAALLALPVVREAVVTPVKVEAPDGTVSARLVAHVVPVAGEKPVTPAALRRAVRERLPSWMVPADVVLMAELPRNERSKVVLDALPAPRRTGAPVAPATATERLLAGIWGDALGLPEVSATADLWELGADSLVVAELIALVRQATGVTLTSGDLVRAPSLAELASLLDEGSRAPAPLPPTAVQLRHGSATPAVFAFAGGGAPALAMLPLAAALSQDVRVHGLQASGFESRGLPDWTVRATVRRHLRTIRELAPHGPYVLVGHSLGGWLALETARELHALGEDVPLVMVLDTILADALPAVANPGEATPGKSTEVIPPLGDRLRMHARLLGAGWVRYGSPAREDVFWELGLRMVRRHRPRTWAGRTVVFTASGNRQDASAWRGLLTGGHEVVPIEGGHSAILRPPYHRPIAERLSAELAALGA